MGVLLINKAVIGSYTWTGMHTTISIGSPLPLDEPYFYYRNVSVHLSFAKPFCNKYYP